MTLPNAQPNPTLNAAGHVAEHLAAGYITLNCAAITAEQLVATDTHYHGTTGWDLQLAILESATGVHNAARVHRLGTHHTFWADPQPPIVTHNVPASHHDTSPQTTATWLVAELTTAFSELSSAAHHAEALVALEHGYDHRHGWVGGLGWDLEIAIDDAMIAIRDAMRIGALSAIHPGFWNSKL